MFELNQKLEVKQEILYGSVIFYIDDFYLNPNEVDEYLFKEDTPLHKIDQKLLPKSQKLNKTTISKI